MADPTWRPLREGLPYDVSDDGQVRSRRTGRLLVQHERNGAQRVRLWDDGEPATRSVHVLMAQAFLPDPAPRDGGRDVAFRDGDRLNMRVENLEWISHTESVRRGRMWQKERTHCRWGHEYTPENTGWRPHRFVNGLPRNPSRVCLTCKRDASTTG